MERSLFSIAICDDRWCVTVDGRPLATAETAERARETAAEAVAIMRKSGLPAALSAFAAEEPKSFDPKR